MFEHYSAGEDIAAEFCGTLSVGDDVFAGVGSLQGDPAVETDFLDGCDHGFPGNVSALAQIMAAFLEMKFADVFLAQQFDGLNRVLAQAHHIEHVVVGLDVPGASLLNNFQILFGLEGIFYADDHPRFFRPPGQGFQYVDKSLNVPFVLLFIMLCNIAC